MIAIFGLLFVLFTYYSVSSATLNVKSFGAVGDGETPDTVAIRKAFAAALASPGSTVLFPAPGSYLTAPVNMTSDTILRIEANAMILGLQDRSAYPVIAPLPSFGKSRDVGHTRYHPLIFGVKLHNVRITGGGTIDGQGEYWWNLFREGQLTTGRPRLVEFMWTTGIEVDSVTLQNSGFWTLHPVYSSNIHIHDLTILAPPDAPNTDGIDPDSSQNVLIERCVIDVGDDVIGIKSGMDEAGISYGWPARNITVRNCTFFHGHAIAIGSETSGGVADVLIQDCVAIGPLKRGPNIKTCRGRGGYVRNVTYENLRILNAEEKVILVDMMYSPRLPTHDERTTPVVRDIRFKNVIGKSSGSVVGEFWCLPESPCTGFVMNGLKLTANSQGDGDWRCQNAYGIQSDCSPTPCLENQRTEDVEIVVDCL